MLNWIKKRKILFTYLSIVGLYLGGILLMQRFNLIFLPLLRYQNLITITLLISAFIFGSIYWITDAKMIPDIFLLLPVFIIILPIWVLGLSSDTLMTVIYTLLSLMIVLSVLPYFKENPKIWGSIVIGLSTVAIFVSNLNVTYFSVIFIYGLIAFIKLYSHDLRVNKLLAAFSLIMPLFLLVLIALFSYDQWIKDETRLEYKTIETLEGGLVTVEQISFSISGNIYLEYYENFGLGFYQRTHQTSMEGYHLPSLEEDNLRIRYDSNNIPVIRLENESLELTLNP
jgi:hypothetical protein